MGCSCLDTARVRDTAIICIFLHTTAFVLYTGNVYVTL